jgi:hypothetical protein
VFCIPPEADDPLRRAFSLKSTKRGIFSEAAQEIDDSNVYLYIAGDEILRQVRKITKSAQNHNRMVILDPDDYSLGMAINSYIYNCCTPERA